MEEDRPATPCGGFPSAEPPCQVRSHVLLHCAPLVLSLLFLLLGWGSPLQGSTSRHCQEGWLPFPERHSAVVPLCALHHACALLVCSHHLLCPQKVHLLCHVLGLSRRQADVLRRVLLGSHCHTGAKPFNEMVNFYSKSTGELPFPEVTPFFRLVLSGRSCVVLVRCTHVFLFDVVSFPGLIRVCV